MPVQGLSWVCRPARAVGIDTCIPLVLGAKMLARLSVVEPLVFQPLMAVACSMHRRGIPNPTTSISHTISSVRIRADPCATAAHSFIGPSYILSTPSSGSSRVMSRSTQSARLNFWVEVYTAAIVVAALEESTRRAGRSTIRWER